MNSNRKILDRRCFIKFLAGLPVAASLWPTSLLGSKQTTIKRSIPSSQEPIAAIGMGSWLTFDIGDDVEALATRIQILSYFLNHGGCLIDSSPMYGSSEAVIGKCLQKINKPQRSFSATKVWTPGKNAGIAQMKRSLSLWGANEFDLMQVHNLLDWQTHLETLKQWKAQGRIRYIGVTTSHGRRHDELEQILRDEALDFVQFTYNIIDRDAEQTLLPLARERGTAVIINRPFRGGDLFGLFGNRPLPAWATEFDCRNWAQFFLKFIISHPSVTCAIPATSQLAHMQENMGASTGRLPDAAMRKKMIDYIHKV